MGVRRHAGVQCVLPHPGPQNQAEGRGGLSPPLLHKKHPNLAFKMLSGMSPMGQFSPWSYMAVNKHVRVETGLKLPLQKYLSAFGLVSTPHTCGPDV